MSRLLTRRTLVTAGLATATGAAGLGAAAQFAGRYGLIPPDHAGLWGIGESLTYSAQRLLTSGQSLAREFPAARSRRPGGERPGSYGREYRGLLADGFKDWRLTVDGMVRALCRFPSKS